MTTEPRASLVEGLVARLRQGQLVRASEPMNIGEHGIAWSGEVRQLAHPDATAAADMIEQLASEVSRLEALHTHGDGEGLFRLGARVEKKRGSAWHGRVVGFYSTDLTPVGYAVESEREPGSVQIYPEAALRLAAPTQASSREEGANG